MSATPKQERKPPSPCPDCGSWWPPEADRCPTCLLSADDLTAAAALFDRMFGRRKEEPR